MTDHTVSFDRVADIYDETRALPAGAMAAFLTRVTEVLGDARHVIEVGVGTGRVAVPLSEAGFTVTGVDVSERMLDVLRSKGAPVHVHRADATDLPFGDDTFDAGLAVHVFHLIPAWRTAVAELVRVVRPGRPVICPWLETDDPLTSWADRLAVPSGTRPSTVGAAGPGELRDQLEALGATVVDAAPVELQRITTLRQVIDDFAAGTWSRTWQIDDATRLRAAQDVRATATAEGVDLDAPHTGTRRITLMVARVATGGAVEPAG